MYPIQDQNHRVIGFGGRVMSDAKPKYLNSPETMIFDKSRNLYGLNFARTSRKNHFILCEGYMDVIAMHQAGFTEAVASLGTAFTSGQASLLHRYTDAVYLAYDSDGAGVNAALRAIGILRDAGMTAKVINMKPHKDPDEFIKNLGVEAFQERIDQAENSFFFEVRILEAGFNLKDPDEKTRFIKEIASKLVTFQDEITRENYLNAISEKYSINPESLKKQVAVLASKSLTDYVRPERPKSGIQKKDVREPAKKIQSFLLTWLCEEPKIYDLIKPYITIDDFTDDVYKKVSVLSPGEKARVATVAGIFNTELVEITENNEKEKALHDLVLNVKRNSFDALNEKPDKDASDAMKIFTGKKALEQLKNIQFHIQ